MSENLILHSFNNTQVYQRITDGYINLNQMAEATGKRIDNWLRLEQTKELIEEFDNSDSSDLRNRLKAIITLKGTK